MKIHQHAITLPAQKRGFHLITSAVLQGAPGIRQFRAGLCQVFIQHTSASLTINENADPTVRKDFETYFNKAVPENDPDYLHNDEGPDDMPAHLKAAMLGSSVLIPISNGQLALGIWQGIYLCEHRNHGGERDIVVTFGGNEWGLKPVLQLQFQFISCYGKKEVLKLVEVFYTYLGRA
jgi:secondary thiamine-phosphate synthase enzyme